MPACRSHPKAQYHVRHKMGNPAARSEAGPGVWGYRSSSLRKFDDFLRGAALGLAGDLELHLDRPQNLARLSSDCVGTVRQDIVCLEVGQSFPKNVFEAASR